MKLNINFKRCYLARQRLLAIFLMITLAFSSNYIEANTLTNSNSNTNKVNTSNTSESTLKIQSKLKSQATSKTESMSKTSSKSSIFESFQIFNRFGKKGKSPVNPFDPNGKGFDISQVLGNNNPGNSFGDNGQLNLSGGPTFWKGWVKFFRYPHDDNHKSPKAFYENPEYTEQFKRFKSPTEVDEKDGTVYKYPHNKNDFYGILFKNEFTVSRSKENAFQTNYDTLKIDYISPVSEDNGFTGGISNMGSFKEGECFKISTDKAGKWNWVFCTEDAKEKGNAMGSIKKLVIKNQRNRGVIITGSKAEKTPKAQGASSTSSVSDVTSTPDAIKNEKDGHWIILQDWSTCDKFCGGGTQTLHRMCIPPQSGGQPCVGEAEVKKPCNEQACPQDDFKVIPMTKKKNKIIKTLKPVLNVLPFSDRPQRYDKCHLKESDLLLTTEFTQTAEMDKGMKMQATQIPVRVVMNEHTISAYAGLKETDKKISFDISKVNFYHSARDLLCFEIKEVGTNDVPIVSVSQGLKNFPNRAEFCPFGANGSPEIKQEWDYDFHLFKHQCNKGDNVKKVNAIIDPKEIEDELAKKKNEIKIDLVNEKKQNIMLKDATQPSSHLKKVKEKSLDAIKKELKLEMLVEQEIKEGEQEEVERKQKQLEKEKRKLDTLNKAIKQKQIENDFNVDQAAKEDRLNNIKKQVNITINMKRERLKQKINKLKKMTENRINSMDTQIKNIRLEMFNSLENNNNYNPDRCRSIVNAKSELEYQNLRRNYCDSKMADDPEDYQKCKESNRADLIKLCCDYETDPEKADDYKKCIAETPVPPTSNYDDMRFFWGRPYHRNVIENVTNNVLDQVVGNKLGG